MSETTTVVGNVAKMREALECIDSIAKYLEAGTIRDIQHAYRNIQDRVRIALAAPPRNCDVGTVEEQGTRCLAEIDVWRGGGPRVIDSIMKWAQMPYEEGGSK